MLPERPYTRPKYGIKTCGDRWTEEETMEHQWDVIEGTIADLEEIKRTTTAGTPRHERAVKMMLLENTRMVRMGILGKTKAGKRAKPIKGGHNGKHRSGSPETPIDGGGEEMA